MLTVSTSITLKIDLVARPMVSVPGDVGEFSWPGLCVSPAGRVTWRMSDGVLEVESERLLLRRLE